MGNNGHAAKHAWRFFRAGGFDQVRLDSGSDLVVLDQLDQKLWVALSCPTQGLEFDGRTLDLIDTDHDGRIRVPEILAATRWTVSLLKDPDQLLKSSGELPLAAINEASDEGRQILASARQILANLGKPDSAVISIDDTTDTQKIFAQTRFNGDGIIPAESADDEATRGVIADVIDCLGFQIDRSGKPGIDQETADQFFAEAKAFSDWWAKAETESGSVFPLGPSTPAAAEALGKVKVKIDDYFARCRLAAFDPRALTAVNRREEEYLAVAARDLTVTDAEIAAFPLSRVEPGKPLPLVEGLNPAWVAPMREFTAAAVRPLLGDRSVLSESEFADLTARLAAYETWQAAKAGTLVEKLGLPRVRDILAGDGQSRIAALILQDKILEAEARDIAAVDKLVRFSRDLYTLLNNFVNFRHFYGRKDKAVFQAGTLYLDQRSCDLCVRVEDMARHGALAHLSRTYLAYCELTRKATGEKTTIAAAFTDGDSDNLIVGRNGIFYDRNGHDWDATIVKIVDNPISIRQAFWLPYKRALRWVEEQVAKRATAADAAAHDKLTSAAAEIGQAAEAGQPPRAKPKIDVGVVAALGVAVAGITTTLGIMLQAFFGLGKWMPLGILALMALISGPSMVIAWLKLRQRNLGPILDASGWAVNANAKINIPFGASLTATAKLPPGSRRDLNDPYAESTAGRNRAIVAGMILLAAWALWNFGAMEKVIPNTFPKSEWVAKRLSATTMPVR